MKNKPRPQEGDLEPGDDLPGELVLPKPADDDERYTAEKRTYDEDIEDEPEYLRDL